MFVLGTMLAGHRTKAEAAAVRPDRIGRDHEVERAAAVLQERSRIARELHDVITHDVSLIVMQGSVERRLSAGSSEDALASFEAIGRDALSDPISSNWSSSTTALAAARGLDVTEEHLRNLRYEVILSDKLIRWLAPA